MKSSKQEHEKFIIKSKLLLLKVKIDCAVIDTAYFQARRALKPWNLESVHVTSRCICHSLYIILNRQLMGFIICNVI